jgi:peptidyl-prolyl cis-trans isomerase SurA
MKDRFSRLLSTATLALLTCGVQAQTASPTSLGLPAARTEQADYIVAVVNDEPITNSEVQRALRDVQAQPQQASDPALRAELLDQLINRKVQLQLARQTGVRIDDAAVDQAEASVAQQNQLSVPQLHQRLTQEGLSLSQFRQQLREQLTLKTLRERAVDPTVQVSDLDVEQYLQTQQSPQERAKQAINLAQIMISVPESASPAQIAALQDRAQEALQKARSGASFDQLIASYGDPAARANAGNMGLRLPDRYPGLFVQAVRDLQPGQVSQLIRSPAGFHVLRLLERVNPNLPPPKMVQSHARHILLRTGSQLSTEQAIAKLNDFRQRISSGRATFERLAREFSQDGSAAQGGDLGWASPGMFVPEFEDVMNRLTPGQISPPFASRFGVHLVQLLERREQALTEEQTREAVRAMLRNQKLEEAYRDWARELRERAYVDVRQAPQ